MWNLPLSSLPYFLTARQKLSPHLTIHPLILKCFLHSAAVNNSASRSQKPWLVSLCRHSKKEKKNVLRSRQLLSLSCSRYHGGRQWRQDHFSTAEVAREAACETRQVVLRFSLAHQSEPPSLHSTVQYSASKTATLSPWQPKKNTHLIPLLE